MRGDGVLEFDRLRQDLEALRRSRVASHVRSSLAPRVRSATSAHRHDSTFTVGGIADVLPQPQTTHETALQWRTMRAYCPHTSTEGRFCNQPTPQPSDSRPCSDTNSALRGSMRSRSPSRRSPGFGPAFRDDRALPSAEVFDIQRQPVPVGSVGADTRLCCLSSRGRVGGVATEWSSAPRCPRSARCSIPA